jgi:hypothetical protein
MQQLTFDELIDELDAATPPAVATETSRPEPSASIVPVNVTVADEDARRLGRQSDDIYRALVEGAKFNIELVVLPTRDGRRRFIHNMTARISEIRDYLEPMGLDVLTYRLPDGVWLYRLGPRQADSRHIDIALVSLGRARMWNCPCCKSITIKNVEIDADEKSVQKSIEQNPLCPSCQTRLEYSPCP